MLPGTEPSLDFLIVANYAEVINGRLFLGGGCLESLVAFAGLPATISVAIGALVPWLATNRDHPLNVRLENADGQVLMGLQFQIRAGRPAELEDGASQRALSAFNLAVPFPAAGRYTFVAVLGTEERRASIVVRMSAPQTLPPPAEAGE